MTLNQKSQEYSLHSAGVDLLQVTSYMVNAIKKVWIDLFNDGAIGLTTRAVKVRYTKRIMLSNL